MIFIRIITYVCVYVVLHKCQCFTTAGLRGNSVWTINRPVLHINSAKYGAQTFSCLLNLLRGVGGWKYSVHHTDIFGEYGQFTVIWTCTHCKSMEQST
jgi:hypothetical protein